MELELLASHRTREAHRGKEEHTDIGLSRQLRETRNYRTLSKGEYKRLFRPITEERRLRHALDRKTLGRLARANPQAVRETVRLVLMGFDHEFQLALSDARILQLDRALLRHLQADYQVSPEDHIHALLEEQFDSWEIKVNSNPLKELTSALSQHLKDLAIAREIPIEPAEAEQLRLKQIQAKRSADRLVEGVMQYVVKTARSYQGRGLPLEDLIQEGSWGVLTAIEKFNPERGTGFLTFADDWIRQRISRACSDKGSLEKYQMRIPAHAYMTIGRVQKWLPALQDELGREPTLEELAKRADVTVNQAETARKVMARSTISMDAQWSSEESDLSIGEAIADENAVNPLQELTSSELRHQLRQDFEQLTPQEQEVLSMRFALDYAGGDGCKYTQEQVCDMLGIKKSKLVHIQRRALSKLRVSEELRVLANERLT